MRRVAFIESVFNDVVPECGADDEDCESDEGEIAA